VILFCPFLRPRFGPIATGLYVALFGTVVGGVFAGTLYNGGRVWQAMFVGPAGCFSGEIETASAKLVLRVLNGGRI
jgi:hypothetical protein